VRVRARRLHDGRGVGRRSQQEGKSRHRSSDGADHAAPTSPSRGRRPKTCPVLRRSVRRLVRRRRVNTERLCGGDGRSGPDRGLLRGRTCKERSASLTGTSAGGRHGNKGWSGSGSSGRRLQACMAALRDRLAHLGGGSELGGVGAQPIWGPWSLARGVPPDREPDRRHARHL
jgi:hypothetical protein